jgi:hypothetical protein
VEDRVQKLMEMGETAESIKATFAKGRRHDIGAAAARGFVGSIPFGVASRLLDTVPAIGDRVVSALNTTPGIKETPNAFKRGLADGLVSGVADHIGTEALTPAMRNLQWLSSPAEDLDETMHKAQVRAQAGLLRAVAQNAAAMQTFTARNVVRGIVGAAITATRYAAAATETDSWIGAIGSPLSGAGFNLVNRHLDERAHRTGPEYLLGRTDWEQQYCALKDATWAGAAANGAGRVAKAVVNTVDATLSAPHTLLRASSLAMNGGALGLGLAAVGMATEGAATLAQKSGASATGVVAAQHAARTLSSAGVFASWTSAEILTQPALSTIRDLSNATGDLARTGVSTALHGSARAISDTAEQGVDYAGRTFGNAREATIRRGQEVLVSATSTLGNVKMATANAISGMSTAVSTGFNDAGAGLNGVLGSASNALSGAVTSIRRRARPAPVHGPEQTPSSTDPQGTPLRNLNT